GLADLDSRRAAMNTLTAQLPATQFTDAALVHEQGNGRIITGTDYESLLQATGTTAESFKKEFGGQFIRREHASGHIYFLTMLQNNTVDGWVTLAAPAESAMLFDPMTGNKGLAEVRQANGLSQIYLQLCPDESVIVKTFSHKQITDTPWKYLKPEGLPVNVDQGWSVSFLESAPAIDGTFDIDRLISWTELPHENAEINMGTALYKTTFTLPAVPADEWELNLGAVHESAQVRINGQDAVTLFAIPYTTRIGHLLKSGENTIEVEVTNLPANRIRDYDKRGVEWRIFKDINFVNVFYSPMKYDVWEVTPSGLTGPVTLTPMKSIF
ncbi:MAG: glycosyl hydrolase family 2, partial [Rikenellaceae bacterium]|nr:glycosyl hydrolase family 2 [Rikenellaceae bacterium]